MKTFIYDFHGNNPVGAFMYVRADDQEEANKMFKAALPLHLHKMNIRPDGDLYTDTVSVTQIKPGKQTHMISDGEY